MAAEGQARQEAAQAQAELRPLSSACYPPTCTPPYHPINPSTRAMRYGEGTLCTPTHGTSPPHPSSAAGSIASMPRTPPQGASSHVKRCNSTHSGELTRPVDGIPKCAMHHPIAWHRWQLASGGSSMLMRFHLFIYQRRAFLLQGRGSLGFPARHVVRVDSSPPLPWLSAIWPLVVALSFPQYAVASPCSVLNMRWYPSTSQSLALRLRGGSVSCGELLPRSALAPWFGRRSP